MKLLWGESLRWDDRCQRLYVVDAAMALFVKFWLTSTPPLPDTMRDAAQATGRKRYEGFVDARGRRLAKGSTLTKEVLEERNV